MGRKTGEQYRKAVCFDLGTNELKKAYPGKNYRNAYSDIKKFMVRHGFKHRQYSGYDSVEPISNTKVTLILKELSEEFPWLKKRVKQIDTTDIGDTYDMRILFYTISRHECVQKFKQNLGFMDFAPNFCLHIRSEIVLNSKSRAKSKVPIKAEAFQNKGSAAEEKRPSLLAAQR